MKILYLMQDTPYPPDNGVRIKEHNLLTAMAAYHECHVLSFFIDGTVEWSDTEKYLPGVHILKTYPTLSDPKLLQIERIKLLLQGKPAFLARWQNEVFTANLYELIQTNKFDLVHLDGIAMGQYLPLCKHYPTIFSINDSISLARIRTATVTSDALHKLYEFLNAYLIRKYEVKTLPQATRVHVVSGVDAAYLRRFVPDCNIDVIEMSAPTELTDCYQKIDSGNVASFKVTLTGNCEFASFLTGLDYFLTSVLPEAIEQIPDIQVTILGRNPSKSLVQRVETMSNVLLKPWVEDYYGELVNADLVVFPDQTGTGQKNRVLQAMTIGCCLLTTPAAVEGFQVEDKVHCFIEKLENFASVIRFLARNRKVCIDTGLRARSEILKRHAPHVIADKWNHLYSLALSSSKNKG